jgi:DNA polymerase-3 subunit delta
VEAAELFELLSPSLFGGRRVLVIASAQDLRAAALAALAPFFSAGSSDTTVVLLHAGGAKGKAVLEAARQADARQISCARLTRFEERLDFIRGEVLRAGGTIPPDAAAALLDAVGSDLRELSQAAAQLVADSGGRVEAETVHTYYRGRAEVSGFAVSDRAVVGDTGGALETLRWALSIGVPSVVVADAMADGVRSVARVSAAGRGNPYQVAQRLGMPPWKVRRAQSQARGWSEVGLREALQVVAELNADVKGAAVDAEYALERAVGQLAQARTRR